MGQGEVVSIQVGGGGIRLGSTCWELYCAQHGLRPYDGTLLPVDADADADADEDEDEDEKKKKKRSTRSSSVLLPETETFFRRSSSREGKYVPRAVFLDLESSALDELRSNGSCCRDLFDADAMVAPSSLDGVVCNDRRSYHQTRTSKDANEVVERSMEQIRKLVEDCDSESLIFIFIFIFIFISSHR